MFSYLNSWHLKFTLIVCVITPICMLVQESTLVSVLICLHHLHSLNIAYQLFTKSYYYRFFFFLLPHRQCFQFSENQFHPSHVTLSTLPICHFYLSNHIKPHHLITSQYYIKQYDENKIPKTKSCKLLHSFFFLFFLGQRKETTEVWDWQFIFFLHFSWDDFAFLFSAIKKPAKDKTEKTLKQTDAISRDAWRPVIAWTTNKLVSFWASVVWP